MSGEIVIEYAPTPRQRLFHECGADEALYGGAAGGGKSCAVVMEAFKRCWQHPGTHAYLFRRTLRELDDTLVQEALMRIPAELYHYSAATHDMRLVNGSVMRFRYCAGEQDTLKYQGAEIHWLFIDEVTHFSKQTYDFLKTRLRARASLRIRPVVRVTSNPGGPGHGWVKAYFVDAGEPCTPVVREVESQIMGGRQLRTVMYIPARATDNPHLSPEYIYELEQKPLALRAALLLGRWDAFEGQAFPEFVAEARGDYAGCRGGGNGGGAYGAGGGVGSGGGAGAGAGRGADTGGGVCTDGVLDAGGGSGAGRVVGAGGWTGMGRGVSDGGAGSDGICADGEAHAGHWMSAGEAGTVGACASGEAGAGREDGAGGVGVDGIDTGGGSGAGRVVGSGGGACAGGWAGAGGERDAPGGVNSRWRYTHVIPPFEIPEGWPRYRSFDFGYSKPFSVGWWAVDEDGRVIRYREWYGASAPNVGLRLDPREIARGIRRMEEAAGESRVLGIADPSIWDASRGESIAEQMSREGVHFLPGDNARLAGKMQLHHRLKFDEEGLAMLLVTSDCRAFIRTLPSLAYDPARTEDVDTRGEDHVYDETRYMLMDRPMGARRRKAGIPVYDPLG